MPRTPFLPSTISSVQLGFLSAEEIQRISVKKITNPNAFDSLKHPQLGGLYDPALGAVLGNLCATCYLNKTYCPGHCGHIELPALVYHPVFLDQAFRLLCGKCDYCHHLRLPRLEVDRFFYQLRLIQHGLVVKAREFREMSENPKTGTEADESPESSEPEDDQTNRTLFKWARFTVNAINDAKAERSDVSSFRETSMSIALERKTILKEFFREVTRGKVCARCNGVSAGYRKVGFLRIFRKPLGAKQRQDMIAKGRKYKNPFVEYAQRGGRTAGVTDEDPQDSTETGSSDTTGSGDESEGMDVDSTEGVSSEEDLNAFIGEETMTRKSRNNTKKPSKSEAHMSTAEVYGALSLLLEQEQKIFKALYTPRSSRTGSKPVTADMFFIKTLVVPPNKYRPVSRDAEGEVIEGDRNAVYTDILLAVNSIHKIQNERSNTIDSAQRQAGLRQLHYDRELLQYRVNGLIDMDKSSGRRADAAKPGLNGIKQRLEKKQGLFRNNMMGKRVNFAARSIITPDANIDVNEIGVPPVFAKKLTYPERVTEHNFLELRQAVMNGPRKWPGATWVEDELGRVTHLAAKNEDERRAIGNSLYAPTNPATRGAMNKKVHRHLNNGDVVIINRQPTLHKPSLMAHRVRVLFKEETIRMHYANCNAYNADFDGDEMNLHVPQNDLARAEALILVDTDRQYLSGTAGAPLKGLIQDHLSMVVHFTSRDTFVTREHYHQLLYSSLRPEKNHTVSGTLETIPPAIFKPQPMWTGKQVITTILKNLTPRSLSGLTSTSAAAISGAKWGPGSEEGEVRFLKGYMVCGVLDKKNVGPTEGGLIHSVYELYGHTVAGRFLSALCRLLTRFMHMRGFSCGMEDLLLTRDGDRARSMKLQDADNIGIHVAAKYVSMDADNPSPDDPKLRKRLENVLRDDSKQAGLDRMMNNRTTLLSSEVTKLCLPDGLAKQFPKNQMQTMTSSGAKGSQVNANLISCNLGQQVLEGRRVPIMISGKTLPCFQPFEPSVRAGGYITDRFLTGIRPQEYFFHAMAGREGLIDTAVKTSSSGYLQRCIVKGMEGLKVEYDGSVRDADGSLMQFLYGEDGLDVTKQKYLYNFKFVGDNSESFNSALRVRKDHKMLRSEEAMKWSKAAARTVTKPRGRGEMDPTTARFAPGRYAGATSEKYYRAKKDYCDRNPDGILANKATGAPGQRRKHFEALLDMRYLNAVVDPGEAVGVIAAQSVGEPSTQMTLNTFHLAGHAAKNVTLGLPRLREILMTASARIRTPTMTLYMRPEIPKEEADRFAKRLSPLSLADVTDKVAVTQVRRKGNAQNSDKIRLKFFPAEEYCAAYCIEPSDVLKTVETKFVARLRDMVRAALHSYRDLAYRPSMIVLDADVEEDIPRRQVRQERPADDPDVDPEAYDDAKVSRQIADRNAAGEYDDANEEEEEELRQMFERTRDDDDAENVQTRRYPMKMNANGADGTSWSDDGTMYSDSESLTDDESTSDGLLERVQKRFSNVTGFTCTGRRCTLTLTYAKGTPQVLMLGLVESAVRASTIRHTSGIASCVCLLEKQMDPLVAGGHTEIPVVTTEGTNLRLMHEYADIVDVDRIGTNDIAAVLHLYGVEAARAAIIRELANVFTSHAISVDMRHLSLIADTMTRGGGYVGFNRRSIQDCVSPFSKMTFETAFDFLRDAVLSEEKDTLKSPSARVAFGQPVGSGTGMMDVLVPLRQK